MKIPTVFRTIALLATALLLGACAGTGNSTSESPLNTHSSKLPMSGYTDDVFELSAKADRAYRESRWIDAARQYQKLTNQVPEDSYAWFRLGNTYAQQGAFAQAIHAYEASLARNSEQPKPWFNLSTAYLLNAQLAMTRAWEKMRPGDPARVMIERRLKTLSDLMHDRIEDMPLRTGVYSAQ